MATTTGYDARYLTDAIRIDLRARRKIELHIASNHDAATPDR